MKSASTIFFSIILCIVLSAVLVPGVFAAESSDVITTESQFFNVGYSVTEGYGKSYWMLWDSEDMSKSADVPGDARHQGMENTSQRQEAILNGCWR